MAKKETDITPIKPAVEEGRSVIVPADRTRPPERPMCVVCGSYDGNINESAGAAKWHIGCEVSHPHVIAKVKARA